MAATSSCQSATRKAATKAAVRERILDAAFAAFMKSGYATHQHA